MTRPVKDGQVGRACKAVSLIDVRAAKQLGHNDIELSFNDYRLADYRGRAWERQVRD